jgi:glycosyltransferase domain-containing protein
MVNFSNKLTIILTLAGREDFTQRWLGYMNYHSCPYKIIIGDSRRDPFFDNPENLNTYFPNLNCSYHRFTPTSPDNIELGNLKNDLEPLVFYFQEKLATLINLVETDYVVLDDNDNFYALDDFKKNIEFLDSDSSYVGARGRADRFWLYSGMNISAANMPYGKKWIAFTMQNSSIEQDKSMDRLDYLLANVDKDHVLINWYSIFRTTAMQQTFNALNSVDPIDLFASEVMALSFLLNSGKIKVYDDTYFLQQHGATSAVTGLRESYNLPLRRMILQNRWDALYELINFFEFSEHDKKHFLNSFSKMLETHIMITNNDLGFWKKRFLQLSVKFPLVYFLTYKLYYLIDFYIIRKKFFKPKQLNFLKKDI